MPRRPRSWPARRRADPRPARPTRVAALLRQRGEPERDEQVGKDAGVQSLAGCRLLGLAGATGHVGGGAVREQRVIVDESGGPLGAVQAGSGVEVEQAGARGARETRQQPDPPALRPGVLVARDEPRAVIAPAAEHPSAIVVDGVPEPEGEHILDQMAPVELKEAF